jgi:hypothetical protein
VDPGIGTGKQSGAGELRRSQPGRQTKEIDRMCGLGFIATLLAGVMLVEFAENDGAHGGTLGGRVELPVEAKALTTDATVKVLPEVRSSE